MDRRRHLDRQSGRLGPLQAPESIRFDALEEQQLAGMRRRALVGNAAQVAQGLRHLAAELSLDEIVINTWAHDPAVRRRHSYALLAREFGLDADGGRPARDPAAG